MRLPLKNIIVVIIIVFISIYSTEIYAGTEPPNPGGDPSTGGPPVGGGAPVGNGIYFLLTASIVYLSYKIYVMRKTSDRKDQVV